MRKILLPISLILTSHLMSQSNLIPNPGFESRIRDSRCDYGTDDNSQYNSIEDAIQNDIYDWKRATCNGFSFGPIDYTCQYEYSAPDWMDPNFCSGLVFGYFTICQFSC